MVEVITLPLEFKFENIQLTINPVIIKYQKEMVLGDCGYPGFKSKIAEAMSKKSLNINDLSKIIITHHDHDHMGALNEIVNTCPNIEVLASIEQAPYLLGDKKSLRLKEAIINQEKLSGDERKEHQKFIEMIKSVKTINKVTKVKDGDNLLICKGLKIIDTSGHMPGHISIYVPEAKTLIAGDALAVKEGKLTLDKQFVMNLDQAVESVRKLLDYEIDKIICYHGGEYTKNIRESLIRIAQGEY